jgi:hypothetical protein
MFSIIWMERSATIFKGRGIKEEFFKSRGAYEHVFLVQRPLKMKVLRPFEKPENINLATEHHNPVTRAHQKFSFSFCTHMHIVLGRRCYEPGGHISIFLRHAVKSHNHR